MATCLLNLAPQAGLVPVLEEQKCRKIGSHRSGSGGGLVGYFSILTNILNRVKVGASNDIKLVVVRCVEKF